MAASAGLIASNASATDTSSSRQTAFPGHWLVTWLPPEGADWPGWTYDSAETSMPTEGGADALFEWARRQPGHKRRNTRS